MREEGFAAMLRLRNGQTRAAHKAAHPSCLFKESYGRLRQPAMEHLGIKAARSADGQKDIQVRNSVRKTKIAMCKGHVSVL